MAAVRSMLTLILLFSAPAWTYFQRDMMKAKVSAKAENRWTLADWLSQKSRNRLQDQWLAMNRSQNWFELNLGGGYTAYRRRTVDIDGALETRHSGAAYHADMYLSIFNVFGEYEITEDRVESYGGGAGLRLLGTSSQTTGLVLRYGWRKRQNLPQLEAWENEYVEALMQLYVFKGFGVTAKYRHYGPGKSNSGHDYDGVRLTAGTFIEYGILRAYVDFYREPTHVDRGGEVTEERRDGQEYGLRFHF